MTDRKTTVHRSEHLRVDKFVSFIPVTIYQTLIILPLLFQFAKRNEKVMPPPVCMYVLNFTSKPPSVLLSFSPMLESVGLEQHVNQPTHIRGHALDHHLQGQ